MPSKPLYFDAPQKISISKENMELTQEIQRASNQELTEALTPSSGFTWLFFTPLLLLLFAYKWRPKRKTNYRAKIAYLKSEAEDYTDYVTGLDSILKQYLSTKEHIKAHTMSSEELEKFLKKTYGVEENSKEFFHLKDMARFGHYPLNKQDALQAKKLVTEVIKKIERSTMR